MKGFVVYEASDFKGYEERVSILKIALTRQAAEIYLSDEIYEQVYADENETVYVRDGRYGLVYVIEETDILE